MSCSSTSISNVDSQSLSAVGIDSTRVKSIFHGPFKNVVLCFVRCMRKLTGDFPFSFRSREKAERTPYLPSCLVSFAIFFLCSQYP
ncbi:hypothetical protein NY2A_b613L [Paramecium bursaria Chlorella virus NY2A]|uniref:Uncharacterized protein b613L n=1 Tax=Paramecium bursaria Chlorella virus NY2A TaxID=46021 RepID=A7IXD8_PBCVN|nr:hypothetical protein NY2A_b613L [Paramecium bursaria Chlorella virus NY2A]ABT15012.1 hypothetical protein NY2A_b613L [Paramecium bursaria Chlorella virus NY2A]